LQKDKNKEETLLLNQILETLSDRKAQDITCIDLRNNEDAIVDYFVVCHGDSTTQVASIADNMEKDVKDKLHITPYRVQGTGNALWVIIDYIDIVVHVFYREMRDFYRLEDLWSDSKQSLHK